MAAGPNFYAVWHLSGTIVARTPAGMALNPDGAVQPPPSARLGSAGPWHPWRDRRFVTLAAAMALGLFAQIGLLAHLFSLPQLIAQTEFAPQHVGRAVALIAGRPRVSRGCGTACSG